jgi:hypothetical protein
MHLGVELRPTVPQTIVPGFRSSREGKKHCEKLCTEAIIEGFILLAGNYLVAKTSIVCLCLLIVNGLSTCSTETKKASKSIWEIQRVMKQHIN